MRHLAPGAGILAAMNADTLSITAFQVGNGWMDRAGVLHAVSFAACQAGPGAVMANDAGRDGVRIPDFAACEQASGKDWTEGDDGLGEAAYRLLFRTAISSKRLAICLRASGTSGPESGLPCPGATVVGFRAASFCTEERAAFQSEVK